MMRYAGQVLVCVLVLVLLMPGVVSAQVPADVWRTFAKRMDVGVELNVRLRSGQKFRATLIDAREDVVLVQPKMRIPVPVQPVPYDEIASLDRAKGGIGAAKAVGIGVASGVGAFFGVLLLLFAAWGD
ncbi:MAG TPA: hypothetical protein VI485_17765 [Vicinamibacterales bacterium]|nr:hypothetical protein [Vicinamibacterales bacterium]